MLFQLSDSLVNYNSSEEEKVLSSIAKLLNCYLDGYILLTASVLVCRFFGAKFKDSRLLKALNHIDQTRSQLPSVLWRISVVLDSPNYSKYEIGLSYFEKANDLFNIFFLSENINDIAFYGLITKAYYPEASLRYIPAMGGGSCTSKVLEYIRSYGFVLVIVDSDRRYKKAPLGDTASACKKTIRSNNTFVYLKVLDIHEVENLIPLSSIGKIKMNRESRTLLRKVLASKYYDFLPFFDYKDGIGVGDMATPLYQSFAEAIYSRLYCKGKKNVTQEFIKHVGTCKKNKKKVICGFRKDMMDEFLELYKHDPEGCIADILSYDIMSSMRKQIADIVFTFCCSRGSTPIN